MCVLSPYPPTYLLLPKCQQLRSLLLHFHFLLSLSISHSLSLYPPPLLLPAMTER